MSLDDPFHPPATDASATGPDPVQLLTADGRRVTDPRYSFDGTLADVQDLYRDLVLVRRIDTEAFALQRHGELGLWPPLLGQEGAQVGAARAMRSQDFAFPTYRDHGVVWCRGEDPTYLLGIFRGASLGGWDPADHNIALPNIIIGAQTLHATGYAMALTIDGEVGTGDPDRDAAAIAFLGDGATSQGDVNEALDWAAVHQAPVVFFCQNNHYAISVPLERQTRVPIAQRADGFGLPGVRVDGNDVLACLAVTRAALQRARDGQGPTLIEAVTYRMGAHTTSDDPTRYREAAEVDAWKAKDPLARVEAHLRAEGVGEEWFTDLQAEADALGVRLREACRDIPEPDLAELFDHVYVESTVETRQQQAEHIAWRDSFEGSVA
jgi:2-oxoisovalerate dehydrogenase E1 component alpha subunit